MITKRTAYEITVSNRACQCGCCHATWHGQFLGRPDNAKIAEAIRHAAAAERVTATTLDATPDAPGSWVGGAPSNSEMAGYRREYAEIWEALAIQVERGEAKVVQKTFDLYETNPE